MAIVESVSALPRAVAKGPAAGAVVRGTMSNVPSRRTFDSNVAPLVT
jgi:hypothetical protein